MSAVLSLIFLFILIFCIWAGYKKGLIMGVLSLVAFAVSVYGANLLAETYSGEVIGALRPFASGYVEVNVIDASVRPAMGIDSANLSINDFFAQYPDRKTEFCTLTYEGMGIYESASEQMAGEAVAYAEENDAEIVDAIVEILCERIAYVGAFIIAFIMILIILTVIGNIPNVSFQIPNHELLNDVGGAVTGLLQGLAFCLIIGWALRFAGIILSQETLSSTFLVSWFMDRTVFVHILGI